MSKDRGYGISPDLYKELERGKMKPLAWHRKV